MGPAVEVSRIIDGDTIAVLRGGREERVRLIGVDAPEVDWYGGTAECYGTEAGGFLRGLLGGRRVHLETGRDAVDRYGRTLAYVHLPDGRMVNEILVRRGYAVVRIYAPNHRHDNRLQRAEARARAGGRGLWSACP